MFCVIAAEPEAVNIIRGNLQKRFPDWRFETAVNSEQLFRYAELKPDVVLVSRFLPGDSSIVLKRLPVEFPSSHIVLMTGILNEQAKTYIRHAAKYGLTNIVTGKLPGDRPYTLFTALTQARQELLEIQDRLEWEEKVEEEKPYHDIQDLPVTVEPGQVNRKHSGPVIDESCRDTLTGCYNRRYLENIALDNQYSVVFIDIDNFKAINDIFGHEAGDKVLAAFGKMLIDNLKGRDIAIRWGGDEFVIVLPGTVPETAEKIAEKLLEEWKKVAPYTGTIRVGFSYGVGSGKGMPELMMAVKTADLAMYERKQETKHAPMRKKYYSSASAYQPSGKFIMVVANKGGVGKTTVSVALSITLARSGIPVCLCDFDFGGPNIAVFFDIKNKPGIEKLSGKTHIERFVRELLVKVEDNLMVLPGPMDRSLPYFEPHQLAEVVNVLSQDYLVIGDTPPEFWTKPWLDGLFPRADLVLAVVDQSKFSEEETKSYAPKLIMMGVEPSRIRIVCNKFSAKLHSIKKVEAFFNAGIKVKKNLPRVIVSIPEDWEDFVKNGYQGKIAGLDDPSSPWNKLAGEITKELGLDTSLNNTTAKKSWKEMTIFDLFKRR